MDVGVSWKTEVRKTKVFQILCKLFFGLQEIVLVFNL